MTLFRHRLFSPQDLTPTIDEGSNKCRKVPKFAGKPVRNPAQSGARSLMIGLRGNHEKHERHERSAGFPIVHWQVEIKRGGRRGARRPEKRRKRQEDERKSAKAQERKCQAMGVGNQNEKTFASRTLLSYLRVESSALAIFGGLGGKKPSAIGRKNLDTGREIHLG